MENRVTLLIGIALLGCLTAQLAGQSAVGRIFGNVIDANGDGMPGVTVVVTNVGTTGEATVITAKKGRFRFLALDPGLYQISVEQEGYAACVISGIRLLGGQSLNVPVKLKKLPETT